VRVLLGSRMRRTLAAVTTGTSAQPHYSRIRFHRLALRAMWFLAVCLNGSAIEAALAESPDETAPPSAVMSPEVRATEGIRRWAEFIRQGDSTSAEIELEAVVETYRRQGLSNLLVLSESLVMEARARRQEKDPAGALKLARAAVVLSPDFFAAFQELAHCHVANGWVGIGPASAAYLSGYRALWRALPNRVAWLSNGVLFLLWLLTFVLVAFALLQNVKYLRLWTFDLWRKNKWLSRTDVLIAACTVAIGLAACTESALLLGASLLFCVAPYQRSSERHLSRLLLGVGASVCFGYQILSPLYSDKRADLEGRIAVLTEVAAVQDRDSLASKYRAKPSDSEAGLLVADAFRRDGALDAAEEWYGGLLESAYKSSAENNLGVVKHQLGDLIEARSLFSKAYEGRPSAEAYLNAAAIEAENQQFEAARSLVAKARALKPAWVSERVMGASGLPSAREPAPVDMDASAFWMRAFDLDVQEAVQGLTHRSAGPFALVGGRIGPVALGLLLLLVLILGEWFRRRAEHLSLSISCVECGVLVEYRADDPAPHCEACVTMASGGSMRPGLLERKRQEIESYHKRNQLRRWTTGWIVGGSYFMDGRTWLGATLLILFGVCILKGWFPDGPMGNSWLPGGSGETRWVGVSIYFVWAGLFVGWSILAAWRGRRGTQRHAE
jgi:tetratricopeptide (TPR) repeat protein